MQALCASRRPAILGDLHFYEYRDTILKSGYLQYDKNSGREYFTADKKSDLWPIWFEYLRLSDYLCRWAEANPIELPALAGDESIVDVPLLAPWIYQSFKWHFTWYSDWEEMPKPLQDAWRDASRIRSERLAAAGLHEYIDL